MIIYAEVDCKDVAYYHNTFDRIKGADEFKKLKEDIKLKGVLDPVLIQDWPDGMKIEIGEQRLLIANEFGIDKLKAFIYNKLQPEVVHATGERINSLEEVQEKFRNLDVPCYRTLKKYIQGNVVGV